MSDYIGEFIREKVIPKKTKFEEIQAIVPQGGDKGFGDFLQSVVGSIGQFFGAEGYERAVGDIGSALHKAEEAFGTTAATLPQMPGALTGMPGPNPLQQFTDQPVPDIRTSPQEQLATWRNLNLPSQPVGPFSLGVKGAVEMAPWFMLPPAGRVAPALREAGGFKQFVGEMLYPMELLEQAPGKVISKIGEKIPSSRGLERAKLNQQLRAEQALEAQRTPTVSTTTPELGVAGAAEGDLTTSLRLTFDDNPVTAFAKAYTKGIANLSGEEQMVFASLQANKSLPHSVRTFLNSAKINMFRVKEGIEPLSMDKLSVGVDDNVRNFLSAVKKETERLSPTVSTTTPEGAIRAGLEGAQTVGSEAVERVALQAEKGKWRGRAEDFLGFELPGGKTAVAPGEPEGLVAKMVRLVKERPGVERVPKSEIAERQSKLHGKMMAARAGIESSGAPIEEWGKAYSALKGESIPHTEFPYPVSEPFAKAGTVEGGLKVPMDMMTVEEGRGLLQMIERSPYFSKAQGGVLGHLRENAREAFWALFMGGRMPTMRELALLEKVFGKEFGDIIMKRRTMSAKAFDNAMAAINMPRAILASWDLSAMLRQGLILTVSHPTLAAKNFKPMMKAMLSEKWLAESEKEILARPTSNLHNKFNLAITETGQISKYDILRAEEMFATPWTKYVPGVRQSERAYVTYLNRMRADTFDFFVNKWTKHEPGFDPYLKINYDRMADMARYVNWASGRGPMIEGNVGKLANVAFWAPRYQTSKLLPLQTIFAIASRMVGKSGRLELGGDVVLGMHRQVLKEAARDQAITFGLGLMGLTLAYHGLGKKYVEIDPRSPDFGKIRLGNTRIDFWGGYQQYARFIGNLITGKAKSGKGNIYDYSDLPSWGLSGRQIPSARFGISKMNPGVALLWEILGGQNFLGGELEPTPGGTMDIAKNKLMPLFLQDLEEAIEEEGLLGVGLASPGVFGVNIQTYKPKEESKESKVPPFVRGSQTDKSNKPPFVR